MQAVDILVLTCNVQLTSPQPPFIPHTIILQFTTSKQNSCEYLKITPKKRNRTWNGLDHFSPTLLP